VPHPPRTHTHGGVVPGDALSMGMAMASLNISGKVLAPTITALEYAVLELGLSFAQAPRCLPLDPVGRGSSDVPPPGALFGCFCWVPVHIEIHSPEVPQLVFQRPPNCMGFSLIVMVNEPWHVNDAILEI